MMFSQDYVQLEDFQYFVVIDFEATCDKGNNLHPQEIIEFPSVLVNAVTGELASFQTYVKPIYHPKLTDFCKQLTGIQQVQVDNGVSLSQALELHDKSLQLMGIKDTNFAVVTWSNCDCQVMLENECKLKGIDKPDYFNRWINLRVPFSDVFGSKLLRCNLKKAVEIAGLVWQGRQHCGLDDAFNTACLLVQLMKMGYKFSITNSLMSHQQHSPPDYQHYFPQQQQQQQHSPPDYQHCLPQQQQQRSPLDYQHYYLQQQCPPDYQVYNHLHQSLPNNHEAGSDLKSIYTAYMVQKAAEEWSRVMNQSMGVSSNYLGVGAVLPQEEPNLLTSNGCILD